MPLTLPFVLMSILSLPGSHGSPDRPALSSQHAPPCVLLNRNQVTAVTSQPVSNTGLARGTIGAGRARGKPIDTCSWTLGTTRTFVEVNLVSELDSATVPAGLQVIGLPIVTAHKNGWGEKEQAFGDVHCSAMTPKNANVPKAFTACVGGFPHAALFVAIRGGTSPAGIDQVKQLYDAAAAKLAQ
jgi:hypothetical protein